MKLKSIVVASTVCLLGLSSAAFASSGMETSKTNSRADMQQLQMRSNQIEATLNQNEGSVLAGKPYLKDDWTKRITVSGELNIDGKYRSEHGPTGRGNSGSDQNSLFQDDHYSDIYLNNSQFDIDATINSWTAAHISLAGRDSLLVNELHRTDVGDDAPINLDEAYVTVGNLDKYPVYGTFGRQYMPFGVYQRHAIEPSLTQYLTQTQGTAAKVGFVMPMGIQASLYTFRGEGHDNYQSDVTINNFGAEIGIHNKQNVGNMPFKYSLSLGYLDDMADTDYIAYMTNPDTSHSVGAVSVDAMVGTGPFALRGNYVTALSDFDATSQSNLDGDSPWAFGVAGDYSFDVMGHDSTFTLFFQQAGEVADLGLPQLRYGAQYTVGVLKDTNVSFMLMQDENFGEYADNNSDISKHATEGAVRLSVDF